MNILDLRGPEFLVLYIVLLVAGVGAAFGLRHRLRRSARSIDVRALQLQPFEVALLAGSEAHAVRTALAGLAHRELIIAQGTKVVCSGRSAAAAPPLERAVYAAVGTGGSFNQIALRARTLMRGGRERLERLGLLIERDDQWRVRIVPALVVVGVLGIGLYKMQLGIERERPVGFLGALCLLTVLAILYFLAKPPLRSRAGDTALEQLRSRNMGLRQTVVSKPSRVAPEDFSLAIALYGAAIIQTGPLLGFRDALRPAPTSSSSSSGSSCSSCGGGGCGGGCGGGGCGGCGS